MPRAPLHFKAKKSLKLEMDNLLEKNESDRDYKS